MPFAQDSTGQLVQTDITDQQAASDQGLRLLSDADARSLVAQEKYGGIGNTALAGLAGVARGGTFGLSDLALTKTGLVDPATLRGIKQANPIASTVGEIGGIAGTAVASGGLSLGGEAAAAAGNLARGLADAAEVAGTAELPTGALGMGLRTAAEAAQAAKTERLAAYGGAAAINAAFGVGNAISEDSLGESSLTAEKLLASAGIGAALGVGGEMLFGAAAAAAPKILEKAGDALDGLKSAAGDVYAHASSLVSGKPFEEIRSALSDRMAATAPGALEAENAATKEALQNIQQKAVDLAQEKSRGFKAVLQQADDAAAAVVKQFNKARPAETESLLANADPKAAQVAAGQTLDRISQSLQAMRADPIKFAYDRPISAAEQLVSDAYRDIFSVDKTAETASDIFQRINKVKQDLDPYLKFGGQPTPEAADTLAALKSQVRTPIKQFLEDEPTWGQAGTRQGEVNSALSQFINARKSLLASEGFGRKVTNQSGSIERLISPQRIQQYIKDLSLNKQAADVRSGLLQNYMDAVENLLGHAKTTFENVPTEGADPDAVKELLEKVSGAKGEALDAQVASRALNKGRVVPYSNAQNALGSSYADEFTTIPREALPMGPAQRLEALKQGASPGIGIGGLGVAGYAAHAAGAPLAPMYAGYGAYRALANPGKTIETLARVSRASDAVSGAIKRGVRELFGSIKGEVAEEAAAKEIGERVELKARQEFAREAPEKALHKAAEQKAEEDQPESIGALGRAKLVAGERLKPDRVEAFNQKSAQIAAYMANPERTINGMATATSRLHDAAPKTTAALAAVTSRALQQLAPGAKNPNVGSIFHTADYRPSDTELAQQERKFEVANQGPVALLRAAKAGRLTPDMVQTGQAIYPGTMNEMRGHLMDAMAKHRGPIPFSHRLQLSMLAGHPLERAAQPDFIQRRQAQFSLPPPSDNGLLGTPVVRSSQKGLSELSLSREAMTPSQQALSRARE